MARHRTVVVERMRRAEPAPDSEEAVAAVALARAALRYWRINLFLVVWSVLNRQAAPRVLDANRRRWGDL